MRDTKKEVTLAQVAPTDDETFILKVYCRQCNDELNSSMSYTGKELLPLVDEFTTAFKDESCPAHPTAGVDVAVVKVQ